MSVYENRSAGCWLSCCRFKDINGTPKRTTKRGFKTKEETEGWEGAQSELESQDAHAIGILPRI